MDAQGNLSIGTVYVPPSPAISGTTLTLLTGQGARFPAAPFNATVWATGQIPDPTNAEIIRVTGVAGDVLTIARAQESTSARTILVGDTLALTVTKKTFTDRDRGTAPMAANWLSTSTPFYAAHRGGGDEAPEHTLAAYSHAVSVVPGLELSVQPASDGQLVCMHDLTLDRTTNSTGTTISRSWPDLLNNVLVTVGAGTLGPNWAGQKIPLLQEVLAQLAGQAVFLIEPKVNSAAAASRQLAMMAKYGPVDSFIWKTFRAGGGGIPSTAQTARAAGYKVWAYFDASESHAVIDATAAAADILGPVLGTSDSEISYIVGRGLPVIVYTVQRRSDRDHLLSLGVQGFMTSSPTYLSRSSALLTATSFAGGVPAPGDLPGTTALVPTWDTANRGIILPVGTAASLLLGSLCPLANAAATYTLTYALRWAVLPTDLTTHGDFIFGQGDDVKYTHQSTANTSGYHAVFRGNGQLQLFTHANGSSSGTQIGSTIATTTPVANTWMTFSIIVSPTQVTLQRTDDASAAIVVSNTFARGGYLHLAAARTGVTVEPGTRTSPTIAGGA